MSAKSDIHITPKRDAARRHPADAAKIGVFGNQIVVLWKAPYHPEEDLWLTLARQFLRCPETGTWLMLIARSTLIVKSMARTTSDQRQHRKRIGTQKINQTNISNMESQHHLIINSAKYENLRNNKNK